MKMAVSPTCAVVSTPDGKKSTKRDSSKSVVIHIRIPLEDYEAAVRIVDRGWYASVADYYKNRMHYDLHRKHGKKKSAGCSEKKIAFVARR